MLHRSQIFFYLLLSFLAGIFIASIFSIGEVFVYTGLMAAVGLIAVFGYKKNFNRTLLLAGFLVVAFLFGVIRFNSADFDNERLKVFTDLKASQKNVEFVVNGYVDGESTIKGNKAEITLQAKELAAGDRMIKVNDKMLITTNSFPRLNYGEKISASGVLQKPTNLTDFDYVTYLKKEGIRTIMFYPKITPYPGLKLGSDENLKIKIYSSIFAIKKSFELAVGRSMPEPNASFVSGILLGSREDIPEVLKDAFNKTGTTHILAISGYNIMIISWMVLYGLIIFFRRKIAFWLSVVVIFLFVVLTGASASVVRAAIMGLLLSFAHGYGRLYDPKNSIILAGAAMAYFNPFVLNFDIGFQLSFAAVLGLMYLYPYLDSKLNKVPKLGTLKEITLMTFSAQIAVAPILVYYFKNLSLVSLPANVLILPFLPAAMLVGFVSGLAGMVFLPLGQFVGWFAWAITAYQIQIVELLAGTF